MPSGLFSLIYCSDYHANDLSFVYVISCENPISQSHKILLLEAYRKKNKKALMYKVTSPGGESTFNFIHK